MTLYKHPENMNNHDLPLYTDVENRLGYLRVYKCGVTTYTKHFDNLDWKHSWVSGSRFDLKYREAPKYRPDPDPEKILVIVRDPIDRYVSGILEIGGLKLFQDIVAQTETITRNDDLHLWPFTWFVNEWDCFLDRMEFVDIKKVPAWLSANGVELPSKDQEHLNAKPKEEKLELRDLILANEGILTRIHEFYAADYELLTQRGIVF